MDKNLPFSEQLEQYALAVAANFIESATPAEQASLIRFLHQINRSPSDADQASDEMPITQKELLIDSPFDQLQRQWQTALQHHDLSAYLAPCVAMNHYQIEATSFLLDKLAGLRELAESRVSNTWTWDALLAYYQSLQEQHATYLEKLKDLQEESLLILGK